MKKKFTLLIACSALLMLGSGTAWGQLLSPDYIGTKGTTTQDYGTITFWQGPNNVNNEFGAGESAVISEDQVTSPGGDRPIISGTLPSDNPPTIWLGSSRSRNIVKNTFSAQEIRGYYYYWFNTSDPGESGTYVSPDDIPYGLNTKPVSIGNSDSDGDLLFPCDNYVYVSVSVGDELSRWTYYSPYTSNLTSNSSNYYSEMDDGVPLVEFHQPLINDKSSSYPFGYAAPSEGASADGTSTNFTPYQRPTTVAIEGRNSFSEFKFEDINWWYRKFTATRVDVYRSDYDEDAKDCPWWNGSSWTTASSYARADIGAHFYDFTWNESTHMADKSMLDGAIQLLPDADICISTDITDATTPTPQSVSTGSLNNVTDAVLVFPKDGDKFELRVMRDFKSVNMLHDGKDFPNQGENIYYTQSTFPTATAIQNRSNNGNIYLYDNSVLGVKGKYSFVENAIIHTESTPANPSDRGMIEVGTGTVSSSTVADGSFYIYSGSYLKNLTDRCVTEYEQINFSATNAPLLLITNASDTIKIINDNSTGCDLLSSINFNDAASEAMLNNAFGLTSVNTAKTAFGISDLTKTPGPIEVHANSGSVNFNVPMNLDASSMKNNLAVISDRSNIRTKNFTFVSDSANLLFHTGQDAVDLCDHSFVEMKGDVVIEHTGIDANVDYITEYRDIIGQISTYPYYSWTARTIPGYGVGTVATVVTVQGDVCDNDFDVNGITNAINVAHKGDTLNNFQSVYRAAADSIWMNSLQFTTVDGGLLVQALGALGNGTVEIGDNANAVLNLTVNGNADIAIQSVQDSVVIGKTGNIGVHKYEATAGKEGDLLLSGHKGVYIHGTRITTAPQGNQDIVIASEYGPVLVDAENIHTLGTTGATGHYLVYGYDWVDFVQNSTLTMFVNTTTADYAKIWSPNGWIRNRKAFTYEGGNHVPLTILAEGDTIMGGGTTVSGIGGSVSFDGVVNIVNPLVGDGDGTTQILSVNDNVNIKDNFTFTNTKNAIQSGQLLIQAGTDIYADSATDNNSNAKTLTFNHLGDGQIIMEAHRNIEIWDSLKVNHATPNHGEFTMKAGYLGDGECDRNFTDTFFVRIPDNLTDYRGGYAQLCGNPHGNIFFNGNVLIDYSNSSAASDTVASVINAYRTIYINNKFDYTTNSQIQAENHLINHRYYPEMAAGNILMYAETGNVEAVEDRYPSVKDTVNITVNAATNNNGDIRIQAGPFLCRPNCDDDLFDKDHGNILFNKPLNITNNGSGYTILQAHRDIETQVGAPATFTHAGILGNTLTDSATLLVAGRHIETHATMKFDYDSSAKDGSITLWAGRMDHPGGIGDDNWDCTDALCKTIEEGSSLVTAPTTNSAFSHGGSGNGSILLFDSLIFNYYGDSTISLLAYNGNIESDPYLHRNDGPGYDSRDNIHDAQIIFNHGGTGVTRLEAIDIKLHDKLAYYAIQHASDSNGQFYMAAFDSILTRNIEYRNPLDSGSVFITTAKYKGTNCDEEEYDCNLGGPGIHQGHIVLGYGADNDNENVHDSIIFDYNSGATNNATSGGNVHILAGFEGFEKNHINGKASPNLFADDIYNMDKGRGKGFGGNITFDYMEFYMPTGSGTQGGYTEIRTPNGNIWGKDSILYRGINGNFLVDAGLGSVDDEMAIRWNVSCIGGSEYLLNTKIPDNCGDTSLWRTGNIMMKGANLNFGDPTALVPGTGNAVFRTREGFIDTYDAFTVDSMRGNLLKYAAMDNRTQGAQNNWGDVSERDFSYTPVKESGSVFFGADDNIMLNYGNSNFSYNNYGTTAEGMGYPGGYDVEASIPAMFGSDPRGSLNTYEDFNPYYSTSYEGYIDNLRAATFDVNVDGYMFYRHRNYRRNRDSHFLYRGCVGADCSGITGDCHTTSNGARDIELNFYEDIAGAKVQSGGFASVASNYIDVFTKFTYYGGEGSAMGAVPGMGSLHGESVSGYGLYMKSQFNGTGRNYPEERRATCEDCGVLSSFPMGGGSSRSIPEMTYIGFHDDARIHTHRQKSLLEAPVVEFFGHAELDTETNKGGRTNITLKADSLIFHDSVIFAGRAIELQPFTTDATQRANDMRYGVINDKGANRANYSFYGPAIAMEDRGLPVLELGYQRCNEPPSSPNASPNVRSEAGKERTPMVGGDIIVAFKHGYSMPMFNTVVANHARISFISDSLDGMPGGEYVDAFIRTDLLRIRNKVEFYTDPSAPKDRQGKFVLSTPIQMDDQMVDPGMYMRHLHTEPGSELSLDGEETLMIIPTTVVGGYGNIHENVMVKPDGILAPGYASLMEGDCQTPYKQGKLTIHNLQMEQDAILRISIGNRNCTDGRGSCIQTDTIEIQDTVFTEGIIPVVVLPEMETIEPGCYLFMVYGDSMGISSEYVRNFQLAKKRHGENYLTLSFTERGKVYLCVTTHQVDDIRRWIDLPAVSGVTTTPGAGRSYAFGFQNFTFTARYSGTPLKVRALGNYSERLVDLDLTGKLLDDGSYQYTIYQVSEPWTVQIGPDLSTISVSNEDVSGQRVWTYKNTLYINADVDDVVSIYNMTGVLYRKVDISAGTNKFTLERGVYVVTLKDGTVHKVVIK